MTTFAFRYFSYFLQESNVHYIQRRHFTSSHADTILVRFEPYRDLAGQSHGLPRLNHDGIEPASDKGG